MNAGAYSYVDMKISESLYSIQPHTSIPIHNNIYTHKRKKPSPKLLRTVSRINMNVRAIRSSF